MPIDREKFLDVISDASIKDCNEMMNIIKNKKHELEVLIKKYNDLHSRRLNSITENTTN